MFFPFQVRKYDSTQLKKNWGWLFAWGLILIALGGFAISAAVFTTLVSVIFFGSLFLVSGTIVIINSFQYWWQRWPGFLSHIIPGIIYFTFGLFLLFASVPAAISITMLIGFIFVVVGFFRILFSTSYLLPRWGWNLLNGVISVVLGAYIIAQLPDSAMYVIGIFVGVDLFLLGWAYVMLGLYAKNA